MCETNRSRQSPNTFKPETRGSTRNQGCRRHPRMFGYPMGATPATGTMRRKGALDSGCRQRAPWWKKRCPFCVFRIQKCGNGQGSEHSSGWNETQSKAHKWGNTERIRGTTITLRGQSKEVVPMSHMETQSLQGSVHRSLSHKVSTFCVLFTHSFFFP